MKTATAALLLALATAACSPTDEGTVIYPQVGEVAADGQVYEYY